MFQLIPLVTLVGFIVKALSALKKRAPKSIGQVSAEQLYDVLDKYLPEGVTPKLTDGAYKVYETAEIDRIVKMFLELGNKYSEDFDCDNFAFSLYAFAETYLPRCMVGVEFVNPGDGYHALNVYVDKDMNKWYMEPQTGVRTSAEVSGNEPDWNII